MSILSAVLLSNKSRANGVINTHILFNSTPRTRAIWHHHHLPGPPLDIQPPVADRNLDAAERDLPNLKYLFRNQTLNVIHLKNTSFQPRQPRHRGSIAACCSPGVSGAYEWLKEPPTKSLDSGHNNITTTSWEYGCGFLKAANDRRGPRTCNKTDTARSTNQPRHPTYDQSIAPAL